MGLNSFQTSGNSPGDARCRVGLLGFGPIGLAVARHLTGPGAPPTLNLTHIYDRRAREKQGRQADLLAGLCWTDRFDDLVTSDVEILVDAVPASEPASDYVRAALLAGKSVVTTNKLVVAHHGSKLLTLAERQGRQLRFSSAIGGAMPIVRVLADALAGDRVLAVDAILSGASNAILARMDDLDGDIDAAVADACAHGYADVDPSSDLEGWDAAAKLSVVCALAFGLRVAPEQIEMRTSARVRPEDFKKARLRSGTIRQIAHADFDRDRSVLSVWVAPMFVSKTSPFAGITGPGNAARITAAHAGDIVISGSGAGSEAVAAAAAGDLVAIARDRAAIVPAPILADPRQISGLSDHQLAEAV